MFDLIWFRNVFVFFEIFIEDVYLGVFGSVYNIVINEESGYVYVVGVDFVNGGFLFINI